jgi:hypothetical protein
MTHHYIYVIKIPLPPEEFAEEVGRWFCPQSEISNRRYVATNKDTQFPTAIVWFKKLKVCLNGALADGDCGSLLAVAYRRMLIGDVSLASCAKSILNI